MVALVSTYAGTPIAYLLGIKTRGPLHYITIGLVLRGTILHYVRFIGCLIG